MRRILMAAALATAVNLGGCKTATAPAAPPPPLITGACNSFDGTAYETLATAHAFASSLISNAATLSAPEKTLLNTMTTDLNLAQAVYVAYHTACITAGAVQTVTEAQVQASLNTIATDQASLNSSITGATK